MVEKYYLPGFVSHRNIYGIFLRYFQDKHIYFRNDVMIGSLYDAFPNQIWNGGRPLIGKELTEEEVRNCFFFHNHIMRMPLRLTYTNSLITEEHLNDKYCNMITDIAAESEMNEILTNSPILEKYLRDKYGNKFEYIVSTTIVERDINKINELCKQYKLVVIDYRDNKNKEFLQAIEDKSKIELLLNEICPSYCTHRKEHYNLIAKAQIDLDVQIAKQASTESFCKHRHTGNYYLCKKNLTDTFIKPEEIQDYLSEGFSHFKIAGRGCPYGFLIDSIVDYLVKPEYKDIVRHDLMSFCWR